MSQNRITTVHASGVHDDRSPALAVLLRAASVVAGGILCFALVAVQASVRAGAYPPEPPIVPDPPSDSFLIRPLPEITPTASNWTPQYPFPYNQTRASVTEADIHAMGEMCQWFNAQYVTLRDQIDRLQSNRIADNGTDFDYSVNDVQQHVDIVTGNIDRAVSFLDPRVRSLTQTTDYAGDLYWPVYGGQGFYRLWEQFSNINNGIKAHQADWFTGPSVIEAKRWGSYIRHVQVCE